MNTSGRAAVHESEQGQSSGDLGDGRSGLVVAGAGVLLLASTMTDLWAGAEVLPRALSGSLLIFGGFLVVLRLFRELGGRDRDAAIGRYDGLADPVYVTDLRGRLRARNAAAPGTGFLDAWTDDGGITYRLSREAAESGLAAETTGDGRHRIGVTRIGSRSLLWHVTSQAPAPVAAALGEVTVPWLRVDPEGRVLAANAAAEALLPEPVERLDQVIADAPLRPGGVHTLAGTGAAARAVVIRGANGGRDVLLVPMDSAEVAGLVPDHFLEELPVAMARLETDGHLVYANRAGRQLLGPKAVPGVHVGSLIEGLGRSIDERLADTAKGRALGRSEVARSLAEGQDMFLQVAFTRTLLDGKPSLLAVISDATELKSLEAQFVQSQKMQAVGQLAGGVAHDFNNLLTAINGHCDLLLMRHDVADVEHGDLMQIRQNANRAAALVRQLLAFSRKQTLRPTVINLQDTLSELTHLLNRLLTEKVTLRIEHGPDLNPVRVDERQLEQVIMNLVVNARDAMPHGGEVRIRSWNLHLDKDLTRDRAVMLKGDYVVVEVADSGTGIPQDKLNKIFEPFYTTKQVGEGTGLGLSTAYGIIKQTGGFIFADSPSGQGAVFTIYLPAYEKADLVPVAEPEVRRPRDLTGRGMVLLAEDEDAVRSFAARALQIRGYTVIEAASGEEALEILQDDGLHVDILVSDVIMPGLDGPAWVREARKARPEVKVIFVSGYAEDVFGGADSGIPNAAFLPKPFTLPELTQKVKDLIDG